MARYTTIGSTYTRKENLGDFRSVEVSMSAYVQMEEGDDEEYEWELLNRKLRNNVEQALQHEINGSGYAKEMQKQREQRRSKVLETGIAQYTHLGKPTKRETVVIDNNESNKPNPAQSNPVNQLLDDMDKRLDDIEF